MTPCGRRLDLDGRAQRDLMGFGCICSRIKRPEVQTMAKPILTQIIERARTYVANRSQWTRYTLALTRNNRDCEPTDAKAVRFCAYGALVRAGFDLVGDIHQARQLAGQAAMRMTGRASQEEAYETIYTLNDGTPKSSREAVLRLFDTSLASA